ncbi:LysR substrate-binding domain-containing protein, partial [Pseudomonas sp. CAN2814]|uniref:LysR substrate-binding domain-containing protein n=1 Tax=Pseudomonas sp. CAN1 TaxID=3046726 RepID=UPI002647B80B
TSALLTDWQFETAQGALTLRPPSRFVVSSNNAAIHAARLGGGYTRVLSYQAADAVARGELEIVLDAFATAPLPIHLLYQDSARLPAKVRSFVAHCAERLRVDPALQAGSP